MTIMQRAIAVPTEFDFRTTASGGRSFEGYAAVFDQPSEPLPFIETIAPGAFKRSIGRDPNHGFVIDHDDSRLLASTWAKTLILGEDSRGLTVNAPELPNTSYANDLMELHARGEVRSMSFTFSVGERGQIWSEDRTQRRLTALSLGHVTVLTGHQPAYPQTSAHIRSLADKLHADFDELATAIDDLENGRALSDAAVALIEAGVAVLRATPPPATIPASLARWQAAFAAKATRSV